MKPIILFLSLAMACGLLWVNIYNSLVDAKSWGSDIPNSIDIARNYFKHVNPGNFYRIFSPLNQVLAVLALIVFWKAFPSLRWMLGASAILFILGDVLTFAYFYPRNETLFNPGNITNVGLLKKTWAEWSTMNWFRSSLLVAGIILSFMAMRKAFNF